MASKRSGNGNDKGLETQKPKVKERRLELNDPGDNTIGFVDCKSVAVPEVVECEGKHYKRVAGLSYIEVAGAKGKLQAVGPDRQPVK